MEQQEQRYENWYEFTKIWFSVLDVCRLTSSIGRLTAAMATYDNKRCGWGYYIELATVMTQWNADMENQPLQRRRQAYEALGWQISHDERGWVAAHEGPETLPNFSLRSLLEFMPRLTQNDPRPIELPMAA